MTGYQTSAASPDRASESSRRQRDGTESIGGFGKRVGDSDLLFVEGQLPEDGDRVASGEPPARQLERCLEGLKREVREHGHSMDDVLKVTLYLADMDAYDAVNETYEEWFGETYPARTTISVCELLGDAAVTVDAVVAIE